MKKLIMIFGLLMISLSAHAAGVGCEKLKSDIIVLNENIRADFDRPLDYDSKAEAYPYASDEHYDLEKASQDSSDRKRKNVNTLKKEEAIAAKCSASK